MGAGRVSGVAEGTPGLSQLDSGVHQREEVERVNDVDDKALSGLLAPDNLHAQPAQEDEDSGDDVNS
jgi:hypothetical protein